MISGRSGKCRLVTCLLALALGGPVLADDSPGLSLRGFGTVGVVRTNNDDAEFVRDLSQPRGATDRWTAKVDSVLGVQANWQPVPHWEVVGQALSRYRYDETFTPEMAWAFVKYDPLPNLSLRAGRLATEFFMLADSRWVGYSFLTVRPPGDFFWYLPFQTIHGADVALTLPAGETQWRGKLFYGHAQGEVPLADEQWDTRGSPMVGGYVEYQAGPWQIRGSYANLKFNEDLPLGGLASLMSPADLRYLSVDGERAHYYSLGVLYDRGPWQAQLMLNHIDQESEALESSDGGYLLLGYRRGALTPYVGYSWVRSKQVHGSPGGLAQRVVADSHSEQQTTILGLRWDVIRNLALKAQWDGVRGDSSSIFPYRRETKAWSGDMDVFSLSLDFVF